MSVWPWNKKQDKPEYKSVAFDRVEFDDFAGFSDEEELHDKYPAKFEDVYDPRFDDFYQ